MTLNNPQVSLNIEGRSASSPEQSIDLARAISAGDNVKVKKLLSEETEDSNLVNCILGPLGVTPLHLASAKSQSRSLVSLLVQKGAKVSATDKIGRSALHYASARGNDQVVQLLISSGADVNCRFGLRTSIADSQYACDSGEKHAKEPIPGYEDLPLPECWGRTSLHQAVKAGHVSCVEILLQNGANVNEEDDKGLTPLLLAGAGGLDRYEAIVDLLVFYGADVNKTNPDIEATPLYHAVALGSVVATQILFNAGATLDSPFHDSSTRAETVLHVAAGGGSLPVVRTLLQNGAAKFINHCNNVGCTPLHKAAYAGSRDGLKLLIDYGGDISACSDSGMTVVDIIMSYVPRPINFLTDCLNSRITANAASINDRDFKIYLDFTILSPIGRTHQMSVVSSLSTNSKLLQHPLVESFVLAKWAKLRCFFLIISLIQFVFVLSLSVYVLVWVHNKEKVVWYQIVLMLSSFILLLNSATELLLMGRQRLQQYENWLTLVISSLSFIITLHGLEGLDCNGKEVKKEIPCWVRHVASVVLFLGWYNLISLIGRFPTLGYYALMFNVVLLNVCKVYLTFISLVIGFGLSFSVQFPNDPHFSNPWYFLVKTTVMMTGEYEYRDLFTKNDTDDKNENWPLVPTSSFIFMLFVLLASVALMNLMVGLAVSDIQGLQTEGHIRRLQKQMDFVSHLERVLAHRLFVRYMKFFFPKKISRHQIPTFVTIQPSSNSHYEVLSTSLLEALINIALHNRSRNQNSKNPGSNLNDELDTSDRYTSDVSLRKISERPYVVVPAERSDVKEDIIQLKQLLMETLAALRNLNSQGATDESLVTNTPVDDNSICVNAMLRRVSTAKHPVVQVFPPK